MPQNVLDWYTVRAATPINVVAGFIRLPAFSHSGLQWGGASTIVTQFNFSATRNFTFSRLPTKPADANFALCVRYRRGTVVTRYVLWGDANLVLHGFDFYNGQIILKNFVLEIWSLQGQTTATLSSEVTLPLSLVKIVTDLTHTPTPYEECIGSEFNQLAPISTNPTAPPTGMAFWYRPEHLDDDGGAEVGPWHDDSGNGRTMTAPAGHGPTRSTDYGIGVLAIGHNEATYMDTAAKYLKSASGLSVPLRHLFIAFRQKSNPGDNFLLFASSTNGTTNNGTFAIQTEHDPALEIEYGGGGTTNIPVTLDTDYVLHVDARVLTAIKAELNTLYGPISSQVFAGSLETLTQYSLGNLAAVASGPFVVPEIIGYSTALTDAQVIQVKQYLAGKYDPSSVSLPITFDDRAAWLDNAPVCDSYA